jgi:hypothetical protein
VTWGRADAKHGEVGRDMHEEMGRKREEAMETMMHVFDRLASDFCACSVIAHREVRWHSGY